MNNNQHEAILALNQPNPSHCYPYNSSSFPENRILQHASKLDEEKINEKMEQIQYAEPPVAMAVNFKPLEELFPQKHLALTTLNISSNLNGDNFTAFWIDTLRETLVHQGVVFKILELILYGIAGDEALFFRMKQGGNLEHFQGNISKYYTLPDFDSFHFYVGNKKGGAPSAVFVGITPEDQAIYLPFRDVHFWVKLDKTFDVGGDECNSILVSAATLRCNFELCISYNYFDDSTALNSIISNMFLKGARLASLQNGDDYGKSRK